MAQANIKTHSGNRIVVTLDGKQVGLIQSLRPSDDYSPEPASGIGDIHALEYVPTMARHSINVSMMVLKTDNARMQGILPENGDDVLKGLVFDITVYDKDSGSQLRKYVGCSYASGELEITKHQIVASNAMFNCIDVAGTGA